MTSQPGQRATREFKTPTHEEIAAISAQHVAMMVALPFWRDPQGRRIVVASFAGHPKDPSWFLNLSDRTANPDVLVRVQGGTYRCVPEILDGDDYVTTWAGLVADRPWYDDYVAKAGGRKIPVVRLAEPAVD